MLITDKVFQKVVDGVKPDSRKRIILRKIQIDEGVSYHIYKNNQGQILLDPQMTIPASEIWLFKNAEALASVKRGLIESAQGNITKVDMDAL